MVYVGEQPDDNIRKWIRLAGRKQRLAKCQSNRDNRAAEIKQVKGIFNGNER